MSSDPMHAITYERYGPPSSLRLSKIERPHIGDHQVLVQVHASSVNPSDWHRLVGTPYIARLESGLRRPKRHIPGTDVAGRVEAVGSLVTRFLPGDEVFGFTPSGAFAEYAAVEPDGLVHKPAGITFEQAGVVAVAAITALQGLRDHGHVGEGSRVLINGASGGVGTFAVQIARVLGAHVVGVCSTPNVEQTAALGADRVIDYRTGDLRAEASGSVDVILDVAGILPFDDAKRLLVPTGRHVLIGGPKTNRLLGPVGHLLKGLVSFAFAGQRISVFVSKETRADLEVLSSMLADGTVVPQIDRGFPLADAAEAMTYLGQGHARAKVSIHV